MQISCQVSWMGYFTTCFLLLYPISTSSTTNPIPITPHPPIYLHIHMNCFNVILINITMIQLAHNTMNRHTTLHFNNIMTKKFLNSLLNVRVEFCRIITKDYNRYLWSAWSVPDTGQGPLLTSMENTQFEKATFPFSNTEFISDSIFSEKWFFLFQEPQGIPFTSSIPFKFSCHH